MASSGSSLRSEIPCEQLLQTLGKIVNSTAQEESDASTTLPGGLVYLVVAWELHDIPNSGNVVLEFRTALVSIVIFC